MILYNLRLMASHPFYVLKKAYLHYSSLGLISDCSFVHEGHRFYLPIGGVGFSAFEEVFFGGVYDSLLDCHRVLDLGGFLGESASYLSLHGVGVVVFEPCKEHFRFLEHNVRGLDVIAFNKAVDVSNGPRVLFSKGSVDWGANLDGRFGRLDAGVFVDCVDYEALFTQFGLFDGLKVDIEGGEFSLMKYLLSNPRLFKFSRGVVECHFDGPDDHDFAVLDRFVRFLRLWGLEVSFHGVADWGAVVESYRRLAPDQVFGFHLLWRPSS